MTPAASDPPPASGNARPGPGSVLCAVDDLPDGKGRIFNWGSGKDTDSVLILRWGDRVCGYVNRCPHFGIPLDYAGRLTTFREFVLCSHHYAAFRITDGRCVEGPCEGASLRPIALAVDGGSVRLAGNPI